MAVSKRQNQLHLPPNCGADLDVPLLFNPYQADFQAKRRLRLCLTCNTQGSMDSNSAFTCAQCGTVHVSNLTAPRVFDRFLLLAGRGGGKTLVGAHAAREEMLVPNSIGWAMGPTYKILHDSTFPTLIRLIPPAWIKKWDPEHWEITLTNGAMVAFRSLEDPERARGPHGVSWGWFDEAAQCPERAYDVFEPTLIKAGGIIIATTTVMGFDWTYDKIERRASIEPGYAAWKWWTEENPLFKANPVMKAQIERARRTMPPEFFDQEYKAERKNAQGLIYDFDTIEQQTLVDDKAVKALIPEWPDINEDRELIIGLDSGADHPFGAVKVIATPRGLVVDLDYLERQRAASTHLDSICHTFGVRIGQPIKWAANKNEAQLRLEFGLRGVGVMPAENKHKIGIQRVQSWLHSKQLFFTYRAKRAIEQMKAYRYADNYTTDGQKRVEEGVFKIHDELPDAIRYALMAWPQLPKDPATMQGRDISKLSERTQWEIEKMRSLMKAQERKDLEQSEAGYPFGDFFGGGGNQYVD